MERILRSDWLPESAISGFPEVIPQEKVLFLAMKSFTDQACLARTAGYWPLIFCVFIDLDLISVHKNAKNNNNSNKANIHPS